MWAATANATATAPTLADIRTGSFGAQGWDGDAQRRASIGKMTRRGSAGVSKSKGAANTPDLFPAVTEEAQRKSVDLRNTDPLHASAGQSSVPKHSTGEGIAPDAIAPLEKQSTVEEKAPQRGVKEVDPTFPPYEPPPKLPWKVSMKIGLRAFWKWFLTPLGFCITIYGLNVVAWGGMLFLLLCNAAPAMCHPTCDDINSPRRKWLEVDSQILNALFCVTGFGLIPWRFRDLYFLLKWRIPFFSPEERQYGLRRLAGIHSGWFRLPGDEHANLLDEDNSAIPLPVSKKLSRPLTGVRAPPTAGWKLDFVIWNNCWNTFLQVVLCGFMWGFSRYVYSSSVRSARMTGLLVADSGLAGTTAHHGRQVSLLHLVALSQALRGL